MRIAILQELRFELGIGTLFLGIFCLVTFVEGYVLAIFVEVLGERIEKEEHKKPCEYRFESSHTYKYSSYRASIALMMRAESALFFSSRIQTPMIALAFFS